MSDIVERLRSFKENVSNEMIEWLETPEVCIQAANEIERLTEASKIDDAEKKRMSAEIEWLRAELTERDARIANQRAQIEGRHQYVGQDYEFRLETLKALLREALEAIEFLEVDARLCDRIRAALGDEK